MPVLMYHEGVLNQGVKYPKCKKVYHKVVVIQWICLLNKENVLKSWNLNFPLINVFYGAYCSKNLQRLIQLP